MLSTRSISVLARAAQNRSFAPQARHFSDAAAGGSAAEEALVAVVRSGVAPASGRSLREIAAEVFGHVRNPAGPGHRSGRKILQRPLKGPLYVSWYPPPPASYSENPFRLTEKQERWQAKLKLMRAAGKGPPKKGEGKRSK